MQKDGSDPVLPTVEKTGFPLPETSHSPVSPLGPMSFQNSQGGSSSWQSAPSSPNSLGPTTHLRAQSSFRRHHRKRSSTIFVQPRPAPPASQAEEAPLASGLVRGVTTLAGAQLLAKLLAFVLNQLLIKFLGARELGVASQLDLLVGTALALSRDALRLAGQRHTATNLTHKSEYTTDGRAVLGTVVGSYQETVNLGWMATIIGTVVVTLISFGLFLRDSWPTSAIGVATAAAITELVAEPCFLLIQLKLRLDQRARAESAANTARVVVVAFTLLVLHISPFLGFAIGHLSYALALAAAYYIPNLRNAREDGFSLLPQRVWTNQGQQETVYISDTLYRTSVELGVQQLVKFFLTEGDKLAVGFMTALEEQGQYALAGNYGSLLARLVFLPVEEALRGYFSRVFPKQEESSPETENEKAEGLSPIISSGPSSPRQGSPLPGSPSSPVNTSVFDNGSSSNNNSNDHAGSVVPEEKISVLTAVLRAYTYLGILATGFGPLVASYVISFVVSSARFGNAGQVLAAYACYIPVLAWNGVLEALVQSVASLETIRVQGFVFAGIAALFVLLTYIFVFVGKQGAVGIVWAQIIAMSVRGLWNLRFATTYFDRQDWLRDCLPQWWIGVVASVCVGFARYIIGEVQSFKQFIAVCLLASFVVSAVAVSEYSTINALKSKLRGDHPKSAHAQLKLKTD